MPLMPRNPDDSIPTRQSLLARMKNWDDQKSWQDFFNTYWRLIYSVALQAGLPHADAQEVVQETVICVARKMGEFKTDARFGSFRSWLLLITKRRIADQFRKRSRFIQQTPGAKDTSRTATVERVPDPANFDLETAWNEEWERNLMDVAMERVKLMVSPRQYLIFHQQVVKQWPARKVADTYGLNLAQVYMAKYRVSGLIKKELRKLKRSTP